MDAPFIPSKRNDLIQDSNYLTARHVSSSDSTGSHPVNLKSVQLRIQQAVKHCFQKSNLFPNIISSRSRFTISLKYQDSLMPLTEKIKQVKNRSLLLAIKEEKFELYLLDCWKNIKVNFNLLYLQLVQAHRTKNEA